MLSGRLGIASVATVDVTATKNAVSRVIGMCQGTYRRPLSGSLDCASWNLRTVSSRPARNTRSYIAAGFPPRPFSCNKVTGVAAQVQKCGRLVALISAVLVV